MSSTQSDNITWHSAELTREARRSAMGQRGCVLWFTGLSGSGKSTVARRVERLLLERKHVAYGLDGDNLRFGLNRDLTFSPEDRKENIRRVGEVSKLFADAGVVVTASFISPYRQDRAQVRSLMPEGDFLEIHVATPLEVCEQRDPKGLYAKARAGEIPNFTGISAPYEEPIDPELRLDTVSRSVEQCAEDVLAYLQREGFLSPA